MGGQEGARGYLYQALACTLEALNQEFWDKVFIEFKTANDKVDIAFETNNEIVRTIQVKSSINLFSKNDIIKWLVALINDYKSKEYQLYLIGSCDKDANKLIKSIKKKNDDTLDKEVEKTLKAINKEIINNNVQISIVPFDINVLESLIRDSMNKYISKKGYLIDHDTLDMIVKAINYNFMFLSTKGEYITKQSFNENIFGWLEYNYGEFLSPKFTKVKLEVKLYLKDEQRLVSSTEEIKFCDFFGYKDYINDLQNDLRRLITLINNIKLATYKRVEPIKNNNDESNYNNISDKFSLINIEDMNKTHSETKDKEKTEIITKIKTILNIDLDKEFFYVGNLQEIKKFGILGQTNYEYVGNEKEKEKDKYINELKYKLMLYDIIEIFGEKFNEYLVLPMVVQNIGEVGDRNIKIKLYLPKYIKVFTASDYYRDDYVEYLSEEFAKRNGIIDNVFGIKADSVVSIEEEKRLTSRDLKNINLLNKYSSEDFYSCLEDNIGQKIYTDNEDYNVLEYYIGELCANEIKALKNLLLIHTLDSNIDLLYKVTSENSDGKIEGNLCIKKKV